MEKPTYTTIHARSLKREGIAVAVLGLLAILLPRFFAFGISLLIGVILILAGGFKFQRSLSFRGWPGLARVWVVCRRIDPVNPGRRRISALSADRHRRPESDSGGSVHRRRPCRDRPIDPIPPAARLAGGVTDRQLAESDGVAHRPSCGN